MVLAVAVICLLLRRDSSVLEVPLGVEQAVIVAFDGPGLAVAPYKWGVAVNVRIAQVSRQAGRCVYDVRYFVNRTGTFDLKDYLVAADGSTLSGLPGFKFRGDAKLSKDLDTRIRETEEMRIDIGGHYDQVMVLLGLLWIGWLLLLIFFRRPRQVEEADCTAAEPTLAETLRGFQAQLEAGTLNTAGKARMEMLLLQCWRKELDLGPMAMKAAVRAIGCNEKTGALLGQLQHWLHHPMSTVSGKEIAAMVGSVARAESLRTNMQTGEAAAP